MKKDNRFKKNSIVKTIFKDVLNFFTKYFKEYTASTIGEPFVIMYDNQTNVTLKAFLFGYNNYYRAPNYGSPSELTITNLCGETYGKMLLEQSDSPFKIGAMRISFRNEDRDFYKLNRILYSATDANGAEYTYPIIPVNSMDVYQLITNIIDLNPSHPLAIDSNCHFSFNVKAESNIVFSIYPTIEKKLNYLEYKKHLKLEHFKLSGRNTSPVIFHSNMGIKDLLKELFTRIFNIKK